jgi:uncharacterized protein YjbI with pentapeptide repeats
VVSILVTVGVLVLLLAGVLGSLVTPVPARWAKWARPLAFWRREAVRQRFHQRRWLFLSYLGLVAIVGVAAVIWVLPSVLIRHPHIDSAAQRHQAIAATRTGLVAGLAAIGAAGGLAYTARTYRLSREGHITDRYSKAVEQLGDENIEVRLGGIYALERLMRDSPADQPTIMETLAAYVRQRAPRYAPTSSRLPEDVQAILTVLGRRHPVVGEGQINLSNTELTGANLTEVNLTEVNLTEANLTEAHLYQANLTKANLTEAHLYQANLTEALLYQANLTEANLTEALLYQANLTEANLTEAHLYQANLIGAHLYQANLTKAYLYRANLTGAELPEAHLTEAKLTRAKLAEANLTEAKLTRAYLIDAYLYQAYLYQADLTGADLTKAELAEANLTEANLTRANLTEAHLYQANLTGANLSGAVLISDALSPEQLAVARHVELIRPPD